MSIELVRDPVGWLLNGGGGPYASLDLALAAVSLRRLGMLATEHWQHEDGAWLIVGLHPQDAVCDLCVRRKNDCAGCGARLDLSAGGARCFRRAFEETWPGDGRPIKSWPRTPDWCPGMVTPLSVLARGPPGASGG